MDSGEYIVPGDVQAARQLFEQDMESLMELTYPNGPVKERHLRLASVIVRRWLCDNDLRRLFPNMGITLTVPILDDDAWLAQAIGDPEVRYYLSAGVRFARGNVWSLYHSTEERAAAWVEGMTAPEIMYEKPGRAMKRKVLYFDGEVFSFEEVLRFACNKLGGAHFDTSRDGRQEKLDQAASYLTFGPPEETLPPGRAGYVHLELENEGSEVLSGIAITVIVAAAMLVNICADGIRISLLE